MMGYKDWRGRGKLLCPSVSSSICKMQTIIVILPHVFDMERLDEVRHVECERRGKAEQAPVWRPEVGPLGG